MNARRLAALFVAALALVAAGCGGSSSDEASSDTATAAAETTTEATTTEDMSTTEETATDAAAGSAALTGKCADLAGLGSKLAAAISGQDTGVADISKLFDEVGEQVPDEIKADWQVLARNFTKLAAAVKGADLSSGTPDAATLAKLQRLASTLQSPEMRRAAAHIEAWAKKNC